MNGGDDADEEVEADAVTGLQAGGQRLGSHARNAHMAVGLVGKSIVHVVRELTVYAERLQPLQHRIS